MGGYCYTRACSLQPIVRQFGGGTKMNEVLEGMGGEEGRGWGRGIGGEAVSSTRWLRLLARAVLNS